MSEEEECSQLQTEESEVLTSIYEGDSCFSSEEDKKLYSYKFGQDGDSKSFICNLTWGPKYPVTELPYINLDVFYNKHLLSSVKETIKKAVVDEASQYLGMSMTFTIFEFLKENLDKLLQDQPDKIVHESRVDESFAKLDLKEENVSTKSEKKEQLTKAQKRRMWDKGGLDSEDRPRGWNWVDVVKHLSQTGQKE